MKYQNIHAQISQDSEGELPLPLRKQHSRYTHLNHKEKPRTIVIHKARFIITADEHDAVQVIENRSILIKDGVILDVFDPAKKRVDFNTVDLIFDAGKRGGLAITPGLINAHAHPPMYLLRSSLLLEKGEDLEKSLRDMRDLEGQMTEEDFYISAIGDLTEEQKNGITTTLSHYAIFEPLEEAAKITHQNVINAISAVSNSHPQNTPAYVERLLKQREKYVSTLAVAIHYTHKASPAILKRVSEIVKKYRVLFTTHAAETQKVIAEQLQAHGALTIPTLQKYGLAHSRTILSHGVHFSKEEIALVKKYRMGIVHLPTSNKLHKSGQFPYSLYAEHGVQDHIALGTDSVISKNSLDLISEALQARLMHQDTHVIYYEQLFKMMTSNAARILHLKNRGRILPGYRADFAFWKVRDRGFIPYDETNPVTIIGNMITHGGRNVRDLMINGEFVISNRLHNLVNETEVLNTLQRQHQALRKRVS